VHVVGVSPTQVPVVVHEVPELQVDEIVPVNPVLQVGVQVVPLSAGT